MATIRAMRMSADSVSAPARRATGVGRIAAASFFVLAALLIASIAAPGVAAIGAFRTLPTLGVELPAYAAYAEGRTEVMGRIAAGQTMNPIFAAAAKATMALAVLALLAWIGTQVGGATSVRRTSTRLANVALVLLCSLSVGSLIRIGDLERSLGAYLQLAREGDRTAAERQRERFDGDHRVAERLNQGQLVAGLAALGLAAWSLVPPREPRP